MNETPQDQVPETNSADKAHEEEIKQKAEAVVKKAKTKAKKPSGKAHGRPLGNIEVSPKDYERVAVPDSEDDPHWDPKLRNPVPEGLVEGLAEFGWDPSSRAVAIYADEKGDALKIIHGKTRWRALAKANTIRKREGLDPIVAHLTIVEEDPSDLESVIKNMRLNVRLNRHVQEQDPMTLAEGIFRSLSAGQDERTVAKDYAISVNDLHGYLLLMDEDKCPPVVQEMLRNGQISFTAAMALAQKAEKMTKGELTQAAEQIAKAAAGGLRVSAEQVRRAAGAEAGEGPATQKQKKQIVLNLQSAEFRGKHSEAAKWAAIIAMEVGLGTRTESSFWTALEKIAQGQTIRVDFRQYISDANIGKGMDSAVHESKPDAPMKGQEKKKAKSKK